ncbi:hypothetical protein [Chromobacterium phragmitis]|uniref:hypothetical protein n=1 Tax=Chromobacterium phragmitis TaxID=2202141 RepID=UPI0011AE2A58|nr:hypothetical protein [Chromobacterium phragmitis]
MAFSFNGIGTTYYGKRDVDENGSYITTKFIIIAYFPIIPIGSFIVMPHGPAEGNSAMSFQALDSVPIPLSWKQVLNVYFAAFGYSAAAAVWIYAVASFVEYLRQK